jgi:hypothetical protein
MEKRATKGFYCREREASPEVKDSVLMGGAEIFFFILFGGLFLFESALTENCESALYKKKRMRERTHRKIESAFAAFFCESALYKKKG